MGEWRGALEELLNARGQALKRYAFLLCGDNDEADDLVQTALVKVLARVATPLPTSVEAFVKRVIANEYLDRMRARRVWLHHLPQLAQRPDQHDWTADVVREQSVRASLFTLSPRQRACVVLRFYDDLTVPQVAQALGCSEGAVKRYLNESMARLRLGVENRKEHDDTRR